MKEIRSVILLLTLLTALICTGRQSAISQFALNPHSVINEDTLSAHPIPNGAKLENTSKFILADESGVRNIYLHKDADDLIKWALEDFVNDLRKITGKDISVNYVDGYKKALDGIFVGQLDSPLLQPLLDGFQKKRSGTWENFSIRKQAENLVVVGSDVRGTVYAIFTIAEKIGISPWQWWADVKPEKQSKVSLNLPDHGWEEAPSVKFRGH